MKKLFTILVVILLSAILTGCWDQKIYEKSGFLMQVGIESSGDERLLVSYSIPVIDPKAKEQVEFLYTPVTLLREARWDMRRISPKVVESGKLQQVLLSYGLAQKGILNLFDVLERDSIIPAIAYVVIVDGSPNEMMEAAQKIGDKPWPSFYLDQLLGNNISDSVIPDAQVYSFTTLTMAPGIDPIVPILKLQFGKGKGIEVTGTALFSGDKLVGRIDTKQTTLLLAMMGKMKAHAVYKCTTLESEQKENEKIGVEFELKKPKTKINVKVVDGKPKVDINLAFNANLMENNISYKYDKSLENSYKSALSKEIQQRCKEILKYTQKVGSDPIGVGDIVRAKNNHNQYFEGGNWEDKYKDIDFSVNVEVNILNHGLIR